MTCDTVRSSRNVHARPSGLSLAKVCSSISENPHETYTNEIGKSSAEAAPAHGGVGVVGVARPVWRDYIHDSI